MWELGTQSLSESQRLKGQTRARNSRFLRQADGEDFFFLTTTVPVALLLELCSIYNRQGFDLQLRQNQQTQPWVRATQSKTLTPNRVHRQSRRHSPALDTAVTQMINSVKVHCFHIERLY